MEKLQIIRISCLENTLIKGAKKVDESSSLGCEPVYFSTIIPAAIKILGQFPNGYNN